MTDLEQAAHGAMEAYRQLVEGNEQAIPMLTLTEGENGSVVLGLLGIEQGSMADAIEGAHGEMRSTGMPTMTRAILAYEAWLRTAESVEEAVVVTGTDVTESILMMRRFVRTKDGVRWIGEAEKVEEYDGDLMPALRKFVTVPA